MIDRKTLLADLKPVLKEVEADLRARCDEVPQIDADLKKEYEQARAADRTGVTYEEWRADLITQVAVSWVLSCVFVRFLEDNTLVAPPRISGPLHGASTNAGLQRARDERETFFKAHPKETDRDYLLSVFDDLAKLPGVRDVFGAHNVALTYRNWLSGDAAQKLIEFFQKIEADGTGEIIHDFTDPYRGSQGGGWDTRFLGDLYQDLSEAARKKYALLQTPIFVEEFIVDRTLEPAIKEFGLKDFKMIDPACGSGHFLLGSFARLLLRWRQQEPATSDRELILRALASVHGVDLNPFAVAIARFRLLVAVLRECRITKLSDAPAFSFNLVCGDSLLHGKAMQQSVMAFNELAHAYQSEDLPELQRILAPGIYHAVVANPPYITVKDKALNQAYRDRYPEVCHMKYSLAVSFIQRMNDLNCPNGFTGQITANSFMKREFGKKLIESYLPKWDLTHVIDSAGAYIPGHGTPTVILFGRNRKPVAPTIRTAMGITGEPATPADPAHGLVWTAIVNQLDEPGSQSRFISVNDSAREAFHKHPWSIGGGGASELKEAIDVAGESRLSTYATAIGFGGILGEDEAFYRPSNIFTMSSVPLKYQRSYIQGETVRDWNVGLSLTTLFPYDENIELVDVDAIKVWLWPMRSLLWSRNDFSKLTYKECGRSFWEFHQIPKERNKRPFLIVYAEVATHNHFVVEVGQHFFDKTAPIVELRNELSLSDHVTLIGLLNSSAACFWLKQICQNKGSTVDQHGARQRTDPFEDFYQFNGTKLLQFPLPAGRPLELSRRMAALARAYAESLPNSVCRRTVPDASTLARARDQADLLRGQMIALQEELDWQCYHFYGLADETYQHPKLELAIELGQRAFEIALARQIATGEVETTWFTRHGSTPITKIPKEWPAEYRAIVQRRIDLIESDKNIGLVEKPEYKRRWNTEPWDQQQERALNGWLLDRLESYFDLDGRMSGQESAGRSQRSAVSGQQSGVSGQESGVSGQESGVSGQQSGVSGQQSGVSGQESAVSGQPEKDADRRSLNADRCKLTAPSLTSVAKVSDIARADREFMQVAEVFAGRMDFDVGVLVAELMTAESVPALPVLRYKPAALDKRRAWERTWELQREEDRINAAIAKAEIELKKAIDAKTPSVDLQSNIQKLKSTLPKIPVPPKYTSADFLSGDVWRLRGKLDVPKERWVSFPHCEGEDGTLVIAWAGYDHLQLARAIAERFELAKEQEGRKLVSLLAAIGQLIPWLKQWHNDFDPAFGTRMGDYFESYLAEEAKALGQSVEEVMAWTPPEKVKRGGARYTKVHSSAADSEKKR